MISYKTGSPLSYQCDNMITLVKCFLENGSHPAFRLQLEHIIFLHLLQLLLDFT